MEIKPFLVEEWMNQYEVGARYNIAETCVDSVSLDELFQLTGEDKEAFLSSLCARRLTYGDIFGQPAFLEGICRLYRDLRPEQVTPTHGAAGAHHHLLCSLVEPGDKVISVLPTYQQLYSIPDSLGAQVELLPLSPDNGFLPDLARLEELAQEGVKLICLNNPNNPTGALMSQEMLEEIVSIARGFEEMGIELFATSGTCDALNEAGVACKRVNRVSQAHPNILDMIQSGTVDLIINTPTKGRKHDTDGFRIRRSAVEHGVGCVTAIDTARALLTVRQQSRSEDLEPIDITKI